MSAPPHKTLVDQRLALSLFLEALLREPAPEVAPAPAPAQPVAPAPAETPAPVAHTPPAPAPAAASTEAPAWAAAPFQALLFKCAGLTLAVPLLELNGVLEWSDRITPLPNRSPHYLGLLPARGKNIPVIDTARFVLPPERLAALGRDPEQAPRHVVLIDEERWGLACEAINEVITLQPGEVRWRSDRTRRAWLAGTVIQHMCALIDAPAFGRLLAAEEGR